MTRKKPLIVAVTGTPSAGKSVFAAKVSKLTGCHVVEINEVAEKRGTFSSYDRHNTKIVRLGPLSKEVKKEIRGRKGRLVLVVGHLAQELDLRFDIAVVVRAPLRTLLARMRKRGYPMEKIRENLVSEAVDYCGSTMAPRARESYEVSTDGDRRKVLRYLASVSNSRPCARPKIAYVERLGELRALMAKYPGSQW